MLLTKWLTNQLILLVRDSDMDKTLLRPLFRQTAIHTKQIETGQIPRAWAGLGVRALPWLKRAWQGTKASGATAWGGKYGIKAAGKGIKGIYYTPTAQKAMVGLEAGTAGVGMEEMRRSMTGGESLVGDGPATFSGGLGMMYLGTGLAGRSLKTAFPGSARMAGAGEAIARKTPWPIIAGGFGALPISMVERGYRRTSAQEKSARFTPEEKEKADKFYSGIDQIIASDKADIEKSQDAVDYIETFGLTDEQKMRAYEALGIPGETLQKMREPYVLAQEKAATEGTERITTGDIEEGADTSTLASEDTITTHMAGVTPIITPDAASKMSKEELEKLAAKQKKESNKANSQIAAGATDKGFTEEFLKMRNSINQVTGNGNTANLVLLKLASGLLTGRSSQQGISGLSDIVGQAMGPTVDTAMALAAQQKEYDQSLATAIYNARAEAAIKAQQGAQMKATRDRQFIVESLVNPATGKPDELFPEVGRYIPINKEDGRMMDSYNDGTGERFMEYTGNGATGTVDDKVFGIAADNLDDQASGLEFAEMVINAPLGTLGAKGAVRQLMDNWSGAVESSLTSFEPVDEFAANTFVSLSESIQRVNPQDINLSDE